MARSSRPVIWEPVQWEVRGPEDFDGSSLILVTIERHRSYCGTVKFVIRGLSLPNTDASTQAPENYASLAEAQEAALTELRRLKVLYAAIPG